MIVFPSFIVVVMCAEWNWHDFLFFSLFYWKQTHRSETIIEYWGFPFFLPAPEYAVNYTLRKFKASIDAHSGSENPADLLNNILGRSNEIAEIQKQVADEREQRRRSERSKRKSFRASMNASMNANETTSLLV